MANKDTPIRKYLPALTGMEIKQTISALNDQANECGKAADEASRYSHDASLSLCQKHDDLLVLAGRLKKLWDSAAPGATGVYEYADDPSTRILLSERAGDDFSWKRFGSIRRVSLEVVSWDDDLPHGTSHFQVADNVHGGFALVRWERHKDVREAIIAGHGVRRAFQILQSKPDASSSAAYNTLTRKLFSTLNALTERYGEKAKS